MRIESIRLLNFKRFTDLVVKDIPASAKLVVIVGPNGCGKSSLFDALLQWYRSKVGFGFNQDEVYYRKDHGEAFKWQESVVVSLHGNAKPEKGCLYLRTAYRNDPDFSVTSFTRPEVPTANTRIERAIQNDVAVSDNYRRLVYDTMAGLYDTANDAKTVRDLRDELIGSIRDSMDRVFGDLVLNNLSDPLGEGAFFFGKGTAKSYHFKNLSGGEKAAFDLLLDLHVKKKFYADAIYCIDEIETHLHTRIQGALLKEMVGILPPLAQLWVTTHSLGVLRAAQEMMAANPGSVCLIDFDAVDPDISRQVIPSSLGRVAWEKMLSIALDDLSQRIAPASVVICEGSSVGNRRKDFDAEIYNRILGSRHPEVLFVSGGSSSQVAATGVSVKDALGRILPTSRFASLADRDDKSEPEVGEAEANGTMILPLRNLESYLFADEVIKALLEQEGKMDKLSEALQIKQQAIENSVIRGNSADDLKSAAGEIYTGLKRLLGLQRCGNNTDSFMRDTLAPLIGPPMTTYESLKTGIIDRLV
ncbi:MAG: AAA family ATPase [Akkermansiaceae bacterium]|nr:AAA family ATPase [Akkermansiaceae bacterium]